MLSSGDKVWCTFTIYNILALLFGGLVIAVSAWLVADKGSFFYITQLQELENSYDGDYSLLDQGAFVLIGVGVAILLQSVAGFLGAGLGCSGRGGVWLLCYAGLLIIVVLLEIIAVILVLVVYLQEVDVEARVFLQDSLQQYMDKKTGVAVVWDKMMSAMECCGVNNYTDFSGLLTDGSVVPSSCCVTMDGEMIDSSCTMAPSSSNAYLAGCYSMLAVNGVPALASSVAIVGLFQVAGIVLSCCLARYVDQKRDGYEMAPLR